MVQPSHPGNVGSAARAIKTMGFSELVLVAPKFEDMHTLPEAVALASGANDVLEAAQIFDTLEAALAPVTLACALTARSRDLGPPAADIRTTAEMARSHLNDYPEGSVAIILGTERSGLTNAQIEQCHRICHIPANPEYSSLNVAQALQLAAWELRYALIQPDGSNTTDDTDSSCNTAASAVGSSITADHRESKSVGSGASQTITQTTSDTDTETGSQTQTISPPANTGARQPSANTPAVAFAPKPRAALARGEHPASGEATAALLTHWQEALISVGFLDPAHPKKLMPRMRHLFSRSGLTRDEVDMFRGVCTAMISTSKAKAKPDQET